MSENIISGRINGHEYVDLGLSVKWATCNVGAGRPSEYGDYFAWGETHTKSLYTDATSEIYEKELGCICGNPLYDAARASWNGTWRLPKREEIIELVTKCTLDFAERYDPFCVMKMPDEYYGYKVTGPNGNSIFFPATGYFRNGRVVRAGSFGNYWCGEQHKDHTFLAYMLGFDGSHFRGLFISTSYGQPIRPVSE